MMLTNRCLRKTAAFALALALAVLLSSCGKEAGTAAAPAATTPELAELTKQLRRYSFEKRQLPKTVEELVSAGYIKAIPPAPGGKKYAIDGERAVVVLVDQ